MSCDQIQGFLARAMPLEADQQAAVDRHLVGCVGCRDVARQEALVHGYFKSIPELSSPSGLERRLLAIPRRAAEPAWPPVARWTALSIATVGLLAVGWRALAPPPGPALLPESAPVESSILSPAPGLDRLLEAAPALVEEQLAPAAEPSMTARSTPSTTGRAPLSIPDRGPVAALPDFEARLPVDAPLAPAATALPASTEDRESRSAESPERGTDAPTAAPTAGLPSSTSVPLPLAPSACVVVNLEIFIDLAGDGSRPGCAGCDGQFDEQDKALAEQLGLKAPDAKAYYLHGPPDEEGNRMADDLPNFVYDGAIARLSGYKICGAQPLSVGIAVNQSDELISCPGTVRLQELDPQATEATLTWSFSPKECPNAPPAEPSSTTAPESGTETPGVPIGLEPGEEPPPLTPTLEPPGPYPTLAAGPG